MLGYAPAPVPASVQVRLITTATSGLCNRLKGWVSAMRIDESVRVIWPVNDSCKMPFSVLFANDCEIPVILPGSRVLRDEWRLMVWSCDPVPVGFSTHKTFGSCTGHRDIDFEYDRIPESVRTTYIRLLARIRIQPLLQKIVDEYAVRHFNGPIVGVHVRSWVDAHDRKQLGIAETFHKAMQVERTRQPGTRFFVASDSVDIKRTLDTTFDGLPTPEGTAAQSPLVELLLLSRCTKLLGTYISTFTEMAWWFSACTMPVVIVDTPSNQS